MAEDTKLKMYGENAATFLIFQSLAMTRDGISNIFLRNLKRFGSGRNSTWGEVKEVEVWLFPNFGKACGFGEPDVLVLAGKHVFWIEVETTIDSKKERTAFRNSLLQMWRFRCFQDALTWPAKKYKGSLQVINKTLSNEWVVRRAAVRLKGHQVLMRIRKRLADAGRAGNDHYVLFTVNKPKGGAGGYSTILKKEVSDLHTEKMYPKELPKLPVERCWYAYWKGHLEKKVRASGSPIDLDSMYVRIK